MKRALLIYLVMLMPGLGWADSNLLTLRIETPAVFLPNVPFLVRVELAGAYGLPARGVWSSEVTLASEPAGILSTNRVELLNGIGSVLARVGDVTNFTLVASAGDLEARRTLVSWADHPITFVGGSITNNTVWSGLIQITNDVLVTHGAELSIQPGTWLRIKGAGVGQRGATIEIRGSIVADGNAENPIVFTSDDPALRWGQIRHIDAAPSVYSYAHIQLAGRSPGEGHTSSYGGPALRPNNSGLQFRHCSITDTAGKTMQATGSELLFESCLLSRSVMGPEIAGTGLLCTNCSFIEMRNADDADGIYLHGAAGKKILITHCLFAEGDDDAIDTLDSDVHVEDSIMRGWHNPTEDAKGISIFNGTTHLNRLLIADCLVGVAAKWNTGANTLVYMDQCTVVAVSNAIAAVYKSNARGPYIEFHATNSILRALKSVYSDFGPTNFYIGYCNIGGGWPAIGVQSGNPQFVQAGSDFHLQPESPCIDAGDPRSARDQDGTFPDLGVYPVYQSVQVRAIAAGTNKFALELVGPRSVLLTVERSLDLKHWTAWHTDQAAGTELIDETSGEQAYSFYRALIQR